VNLIISGESEYMVRAFTQAGTSYFRPCLSGGSVFCQVDQ
jgi:hypothetical protein